MMYLDCLMWSVPLLGCQDGKQFSIAACVRSTGGRNVTGCRVAPVAMFAVEVGHKDTAVRIETDILNVVNPIVISNKCFQANWGKTCRVHQSEGTGASCVGNLRLEGGFVVNFCRAPLPPAPFPPFWFNVRLVRFFFCCPAYQLRLT